MPSPKTIQIFLPDGDPRGIRVAEITTRIVQVIEVPRSLLSSFLNMPESNQVAIYFLVGKSLEGTGDMVYIGQTEDLRTRLKKHNKGKDFWEKALVLISRTNSLTNTHSLFLESYSLKMVRVAGRYADDNGNSGTEPHTPQALEADCMDIFETGANLIGTLGYPLFTALTDESSKSKDVYFCTGSGAKGKGVYTSEGFVVFKGSTGRLSNVPSIQGKATEKWRDGLIGSSVIKVEGDNIILTNDHLFPSPSAAAAALMGRTANGWIEWKNDGGQTLDEVERKGVEDKV